MRFGLVGTGYWARETHAAGLAAHPDVDLVGVWGRDNDQTADVATRFGIQAFDEVDTLFSKVDAVSFAVPPEVQGQLAERAAARGLHLLLEKPTALDGETAWRIATMVDDAGLTAAVFFTNRYLPEVDRWLSGLDSVDWFAGRVRMYASIYDADNPFGGSPWRRDRGALWDIGPHALSILVPVLGTIERAIAQYGKDDTIDVAFGHSGGATSTLSLSLAAPPAAQGSSWEMYGSQLSTTMPMPTTSPLQAYGECVSNLVTAVRTGSPARCSAAFGAHIVDALAAAETAAQDGGVWLPSRTT